MIVHRVQVDRVDGGHLRATLLAHEPSTTADGWLHEGWEECGTTADRWPCVAWSVSGNRQCPKHAAVRLPAAWVTPGPNPETFHVHLCGGHFDVHRLGKLLGIVA